MVVVVAEGDTWALDLGGASEGWMVFVWFCGLWLGGRHSKSINEWVEEDRGQVSPSSPPPPNQLRCCSPLLFPTTRGLPQTE